MKVMLSVNGKHYHKPSCASLIRSIGKYRIIEIEMNDITQPIVNELRASARDNPKKMELINRRYIYPCNVCLSHKIKGS